jgi:hypothetical protein
MGSFGFTDLQSAVIAETVDHLDFQPECESGFVGRTCPRAAAFTIAPPCTCSWLLLCAECVEVERRDVKATLVARCNTCERPFADFVVRPI